MKNIIASKIKSIRTEHIDFRPSVVVLRSNGIPAVDTEIDALLLAPTLKAFIKTIRTNNEFLLS